jgi:hypothetical protein
MDMSSVARKRRSEVQQSQMPSPMTYNPNVQSQSQSQQPQQQSRPMGSGLTLPQVISVIDNRLITLENFVKEQQNNPKSMVESQKLQEQEQNLPADFVDEIQARFDILAREISDLKDVVLKLQSFTMDVNKSLLEERINILSDLGDKELVSEDV